MTTAVQRRVREPLEKKPLPKTPEASQRAVETLRQRRNGHAASADFAGFAEEYTVTYLPIDTLHRHPKNRLASDQAVAELAVSIQEHQLQQPIKVRLAGEQWGLPKGHYQIVFGERRWRAAKMAGLEQIPAHVVEIDDATALELIAVENAQREQLNPIQKAELIATLCQPVEQGGAGKTREQAGQVVGLASGSAASNLVRLLQLPQTWRDRVAAGELPESFARLLLPVMHCNEVMKALDKDFRKYPPGDGRSSWNSRASVEEEILDAVNTVTMSLERQSHYGADYFPGDWSKQGYYPRLFELTDDVRRRLGVVTLPVRYFKGGKRVQAEEERATNLRQFRKLQKPAIEKHIREHQAQDKKAGKTKAKQRPPTAAELKRQAKERAERYKKQLATWRLRWMRLSLAQMLDTESALLLIAWLATSNFHPLNWTHRMTAGDAALEVKRRDRFDSRWEPIWQALLAQPEGYVPAQETLVTIAERILWPSGGLDARDQENLPRQLVEDLWRREQMDDEACWFALQRTGDSGRQGMLEAFFNLHGKEQLEQLGRELDVGLHRAKTKSAMVRAFTQGQAKTLALPKCLQRKKPAAKASSRRRKK